MMEQPQQQSGIFAKSTPLSIGGKNSKDSHTSTVNSLHAGESFSSSPNWARFVKSNSPTSPNNNTNNISTSVSKINNNSNNNNNNVRNNSDLEDDDDNDEDYNEEDFNDDDEEDDMELSDFTFERERWLQLIGDLDTETRKQNTLMFINFLKEELKKYEEKFFQIHLGFVLRLCFACPHASVRNRLEKFIGEIERAKPARRAFIKSATRRAKKLCAPSSFVAESLLCPLSCKNADIKTLFQALFLQTGRVSHLMRVLAWHPAYLTHFQNSYQQVMYGDGDLQQHYRFIVAIVVASQRHCMMLVDELSKEFAMNDGDITWLKGIPYFPKKLQNLLPFLAKFCHQPWMIRKEHIAQLVKSGADSWSLAELVHVMVLASTIQSVAGIMFGCGITPEVDLVFSSDQNLEESDDELSDKGETEISMKDETVKVINALKAEEENDSQEEEMSQKRETFEKAGTSHGAENISEKAKKRSEELTQFIGDHELRYVDFNVKSTEYCVLKSQDYSWKEHGCALLNRFYSSVSNLVDEQFDCIYYLTYNKIWSQANVDTTPFRRAIWYYVQRLYGICNDDYQYRNINLFLRAIKLKIFIKKLTCFPTDLKKEDFVDMEIDLHPEEKCHVVLLATEALKQTQLIYGFSAITKFML